MPSSALLAAVREFTTTILNPYDLHDLLDRVTDHACCVTASDGAGVMLAGRDGLAFASASDERVVEIEVLQDRIESGACHEAFITDRMVVVEDLATVGTWPEYTHRAMSLGFRSVLGVPMRACGETIGVLNVYRYLPDPWSQVDIDAAEIVTSMGAGYVLHANHLRAQNDLAAQLQTAIESRDVIGQAKGRLMERHGIDARAAFAMLRSASQAENVRLRDIATNVIDGEHRTLATPR